MFLLLDRCAELEQFFRNWLTRSVEDIDKPVDVMLASVLQTLEWEETYAPELPLSCSVNSVIARPS